MLDTYEIVPMLINRHRIRQFLEKTHEFEPYTDHIDYWNSKKQKSKKAELHKNEFFGPTQMLLLQPYLELFTDFITRHYSEEFETAKSLREVTDIS